MCACGPEVPYCNWGLVLRVLRGTESGSGAPQMLRSVRLNLETVAGGGVVSVSG